MRAIDVHVHPMNDAYVEASLPFMPAAQRMFKGKFAARPDTQIADDFRRDDALAIPIASNTIHTGGAQCGTTEQVATTNYQSYLNADADQLAHFQRHAVEHLGIDPELFRAHQGFAA